VAPASRYAACRSPRPRPRPRASRRSSGGGSSRCPCRWCSRPRAATRGSRSPRVSRRRTFRRDPGPATELGLRGRALPRAHDRGAEVGPADDRGGRTPSTTRSSPTTRRSWARPCWGRGADRHDLHGRPSAARPWRGVAGLAARGRRWRSAASRLIARHVEPTCAQARRRVVRRARRRLTLRRLELRAAHAGLVRVSSLCRYAWFR
jgi:hypothetical protein